MEYVACFLVAMVLGIMEGAFAMRWWLCRPRKLLRSPDQQSVIARYREYKSGRG